MRWESETVTLAKGCIFLGQMFFRLTTLLLHIWVQFLIHLFPLFIQAREFIEIKNSCQSDLTIKQLNPPLHLQDWSGVLLITFQTTSNCSFWIKTTGDFFNFFNWQFNCVPCTKYIKQSTFRLINRFKFRRTSSLQAASGHCCFARLLHFMQPHWNIFTTESKTKSAVPLQECVGGFPINYRRNGATTNLPALPLSLLSLTCHPK